MKTAGIMRRYPRRMARARAFYIDRVELQALESDLLEASDGRVGLTVGDGANQLFIYPARAQSAEEFTQVVIQVADVRVVVAEMRGRGVEFEEYDTTETRTENGIAQMPHGPRRTRTVKPLVEGSYVRFFLPRRSDSKRTPLAGKAL